MAKKRAKVLNEAQLSKLLTYLDAKSTMPERDKLVVLLTFKAGLRVGEVAKIRTSHMLDVTGRPANVITVFGSVAKGGRCREVPMHPDIRHALVAFLEKYPKAKHVALARRKTCGNRSGCTSANALTVWFSRIYREAGFSGTSSHSGRRTFGTNLARACYSHQATLIDVQRLLGHRMLSTTEAYVEPTEHARALVCAA